MIKISSDVENSSLCKRVKFKGNECLSDCDFYPRQILADKCKLFQDSIQGFSFRTEECKKLFEEIKDEK